MGALPTCTSPGVSVPYSAPQSEAPVYPRRQPHHRAPSVLSVSLRSRRLPSPRTLQGLFHPRCAPGVPADLHHSTRPFDLARAVTPTFPLQGFHLYRDGPVLACPPLLHFVAFGTVDDCSSSDPNSAGASASRSQQSRLLPRVLPSNASLPEVCGQPSRSRIHEVDGLWVAPRSSSTRLRAASDLYETSLTRSRATLRRLASLRPCVLPQTRSGRAHV
jgi:hypothetical protein